MKTKTLAIGLMPDRIDVILCAGAQVLDARRINVSLEQDVNKWCRQVRDAAKAVRTAAQEMRAMGLSARVLYRGPGACAEYASPRAKTASEAASAAILSCADSLTCPIDVAASRAMVVSLDRRDAESKTQVVVAADGDDSLAAISEMVTGAGLKFRSATPLDAVTMATLALNAASATPAPMAWLHFGEFRSFLVIASNGAVVFARPISVGLDALVGSLTRTLRLSGGQTIDLNRDTARTIVQTCGFPSRTQIVHEELQLTGGHIVPAMQPVLQRFMVELRQSLRFALPENQRQGLQLRLSGPGARTPGFSQIAADELGVKIEPFQSDSKYDFADARCSESELIHAIAARRALTDLALEPLQVARQRQTRHFQKCLWAGAAAALALIAFDATRMGGKVREMHKQVDALQTQSEGMAALKSTSDRLLAASTAMTKLDNLIRSETGARVCMGSILQEISRVTPPAIRLYSMQFKPGSDVIIGSLSGYAMDDAADPGASSELLDTYIQRLGDSPLLLKLSLANVQSTTLETASAQSFDVTFDAVAVPADGLPRPSALAGAGTSEE